jgi:hypothetical protein
LAVGAGGVSGLERDLERGLPQYPPEDLQEDLVEEELDAERAAARAGRRRVEVRRGLQGIAFGLWSALGGILPVGMLGTALRPRRGGSRSARTGSRG